MKKTPVALQLWSVREDAKRDFAATVAEVARIGYAGVELAGYGNLDAQGAKARPRRGRPQGRGHARELSPRSGATPMP